MKQFGIDISYWQKGFDFDRAKAEGVEFAILRGAYHMSKDKCFDDFYADCKARNIPVGVYHYSMAKTVAEAKAEAEYLIANVLKGKQFEYPIYMDVEDKTQKVLGRTLLTNIIVAFCQALEDAGYYVGIYSTASFLKSYTYEEKLDKYDKWIAQWAKKCSYTGEYGMWQFGGETNILRSNKVAGVVCDQDYALKDYTAIIKATGLNGYGSTDKVEDKVESSDTETETKVEGFTMNMRNLKRGCRGEDVRALQILLAGRGYNGMMSKPDGIFGPNTEGAVKLYQKAKGLGVDGIVGPKTFGELLGVK